MNGRCAVGLALGLVACRPATPRLGAAQRACELGGPPSIATLVPNSAPAGARALTVEIQGCRFESSNDVLFGAVAIRSLVAEGDGTRLRFVIPSWQSPGADAPPAPLPIGTYQVFVRNRNGMSAPAPFTLTRAPAE
jgi:hypothetical protein